MSNELAMTGPLSEGARSVQEVGPHSISFMSKTGRKMLVIQDDGKFIVNGKLVAVDEEVYTGFCAWLSNATGRLYGSGIHVNDFTTINELGQTVCGKYPKHTPEIESK